jgi:hypothetical protein
LTTEAVYDFFGADGRELLVSDFAAAEVASPYRVSYAWRCLLTSTHQRVWRTSTLGVRQ